MSAYKASVKKSPKVKRCILLLWDEHFNEVVATVFTVALRKAGLCVKVVGVNGLFATGCNRLVLHADLLLSKITPLVDDMLCLILPCGYADIQRLENDPRIRALFAAAARRQAQFVLYDHSVIKNSTLNSLAIASQDITVYGQNDDLLAFAKEVATTLAHLEKSFYRRAPTGMPQTAEQPSS